MKFKRLTIHNIASIEDAVINFDAKPLADSEVFLITGKTGAGKTTILDAICLALYGTTPRLENTKMEGEAPDKDDKSIQVKNPRQLLRRNTGEGFVELAFTGSNGVDYEARWSVERARKKSTGNLKSKEWSLKNLSTGVTLNKDAEIKAEIVGASGLTLNQFCRTTMLAQGEFTRFLNSSDNDKADILEKITGVDIYSKIGAKVNEITNGKKKEWEDINLLIDDTRSLSEEEISERKGKLGNLEKQSDDIKGKREDCATKRDWILAAKDLESTEARAAEELRQATEVVNSDEFKQKDNIINQWNATADARHWLAEGEEASKEAKRLNRIIDELKSEFIRLLGGLLYARNEAKNLENEICAAHAFIEQEKSKEQAYDNAQTIAGHLNTVSACRISIEKSQGEIDTDQILLEGKLQPALDKARAEAEGANAEFKKNEATVTAKEEAVAALKLNELRNHRDDARELLRRVTTAQSMLEALGKAREKHEAERENLDKRLEAIKEKESQAQQMEAPIHDAQLRVDIRKEDLEKQKDSVNKFATTLRNKLSVGDTCPVCGQRIESALPQEEELQALVSGLQKACDEATRSLEEIISKKNRLDAEIKAERNTYNQSLTDFNNDRSVDEAQENASQACKKCGIDTIDGTTPSRLERVKAEATEASDSLEKKINEGEKADDEAKAQRKELERKRHEVNDMVNRHITASRNIEECKNRINTAKALIADKQKNMEEAEARITQLLAAVTWEQDWHEAPIEFAEALITAARNYNDCKLKLNTLEAQFKTTTVCNQSAETDINCIIDAIPAWKDLQAGGMARVDDFLSASNELHNRVSRVVASLETAEKALTDNKALVDKFLADNKSIDIIQLKALSFYTPQGISEINEELKQYRDALTGKKSLHDNALKVLDEHMKNKPELGEGETAEALNEAIALCDKTLGDIGEQKGAINQELKNDAETKQRRNELVQKADEKKAEYHKWLRLDQLIGDATGKKFRRIAQSYVLTSLIHAANVYMSTLSDRYTLKVIPGTFVITLEDAYQGYVSRAASTISGGESFLVSLSLALALSDIGNQLQVDTLFIDEGFGTLSGEPLQNAIQTLRSLHSKTGRHVGIISHVEELQERIPVQIQVNQESRNSSSVIKIIPEE